MQDVAKAPESTALLPPSTGFMTFHTEINDSDRLRVRAEVGTFSRWVLGLLAMIPLSAAFTLIRWGWSGPFSWPSVFFTALGLGAAVVGGGLLLAAFGANDETLEVDRHAGTVSRTDTASLGYRRRESRPLSHISRVDTGITEWTDSPTYHLAIHFADGTTMKFATSNVRAPMDQLRERLAAFLGH